MRRILVASLTMLAIMALIFCAHPTLVVIHAQSLPVTKTVSWDASIVDATHSAPANYVVKLDGVTIGSPTSLSQPFTISTPGAHALALTAVNTWGTSAPSTLNFTVSVPNLPTSLQIN